MINPTAFELDQCLIMAVDDVPNNLKVLQGVLSSVGYRLTFATRGKQVLERLHNVQPDLILLDLMMPEMNGIDVCTHLKQNPETAQIPIIFLTASHEVAHLAQALEAGAVDYITKPFKVAELLARVRTHLELSQLRKQAQRQALWETVSRQIVQDIHASINLQDILNNVVQAIQGLLQANRVMVYRHHLQGCQLLALSGEALASNRCLEALGCPYLRPNVKVVDEEKQQPQCLMESAPETVLPKIAQSKTLQPSASLALASDPQELRFPIYQNGQLWGSLVVQNTPPASLWTKPEVETLALIVQQLEISIQHAELHQRLQAANQELERISNTDGLTQIANRRCFDSQLEREWRRLQREQQPLALILCDIDYFKQFNDTYGHPSGDRCLVDVAQTLQSCLKRPADSVARYGGEEFVVLLPNTELAGAIEVVKQMQSAIATLQIPHASHGSTNHVTLSFGLHVAVPQPFSEISAPLTHADRALYVAKDAGRNRYVVSPELSV